MWVERVQGRRALPNAASTGGAQGSGLSRLHGLRRLHLGVALCLRLALRWPSFSFKYLKDAAWICSSGIAWCVLRSSMCIFIVLARLRPSAPAPFSPPGFLHAVSAWLAKSAGGGAHWYACAAPVHCKHRRAMPCTLYNCLLMSSGVLLLFLQFSVQCAVLAYFALPTLDMRVCVGMRGSAWDTVPAQPSVRFGKCGVGFVSQTFLRASAVVAVLCL